MHYRDLGNNQLLLHQLYQILNTLNRLKDLQVIVIGQNRLQNHAYQCTLLIKSICADLLSLIPCLITLYQSNKSRYHFDIVRKLLQLVSPLTLIWWHVLLFEVRNCLYDNVWRKELDVSSYPFKGHHL